MVGDEAKEDEQEEEEEEEWQEEEDGSEGWTSIMPFPLDDDERCLAPFVSCTEAAVRQARAREPPRPYLSPPPPPISALPCASCAPRRNPIQACCIAPGATVGDNNLTVVPPGPPCTRNGQR